MATYSGPVCNARGSTDVIDTRIYGNPDDIRDAAAKVRKNLRRTQRCLYRDE